MPEQRIGFKFSVARASDINLDLGDCQFGQLALR